MRQEFKEEANTSPVEVKCKHHWIIDSPRGPTSKGVCKFCGAQNEFDNYASYPSWLDTKVRFPEETQINKDIETFSKD